MGGDDMKELGNDKLPKKRLLSMQLDMSLC